MKIKKNLEKKIEFFFMENLKKISKNNIKKNIFLIFVFNSKKINFKDIKNRTNEIFEIEGKLRNFKFPKDKECIEILNKSFNNKIEKKKNFKKIIVKKFNFKLINKFNFEKNKEKNIENYKLIINILEKKRKLIVSNNELKKNVTKIFSRDSGNFQILLGKNLVDNYEILKKNCFSIFQFLKKRYSLENIKKIYLDIKGEKIRKFIL